MNANRRQFLQSTGALVLSFTLPGIVRGAESSSGFATIDSRIVLDSNGEVRLTLGKVELGQGIGTALAQIAAEELGISIRRIKLIGVDTDFSPDESYTFSSISVQQSGPPLRRAAAAGRQMLLQRASEKLGVPLKGLSVADGAILNRGKPTGLDYWQLIGGERIEVAEDDQQKFVPVPDHVIVGQAVQRLDIPAKVFGEASYLQDLRLPDMVHARVVRPPAERAKLGNFDTGSVDILPGVLKVVRDGNFLGVIAVREGQARSAAAALKKTLTWSMANDLPGSKNVYRWLKSAPKRTESILSRQSESSPAATKEITATYQRPYQAHGSISPSAAIALYEHGELTVWSHAQGMFPLRNAIAHTMGLELDKVRCVHHEAAGCFGHNGADDAACDAAALAMRYPGKPVRLQWERADDSCAYWSALATAFVMCRASSMLSCRSRSSFSLSDSPSTYGMT